MPSTSSFKLVYSWALHLCRAVARVILLIKFSNQGDILGPKCLASTIYRQYWTSVKRHRRGSQTPCVSLLVPAHPETEKRSRPVVSIETPRAPLP